MAHKRPSGATAAGPAGGDTPIAGAPGVRLPVDPSSPASGDAQVSWAMTVAGRLATQQFEQVVADLPGRYSANQWAPLFLLAKAGDLTVRELAAGCALRETTVSAILDRLEVDGCVVRGRDAADGRRVVVSITASGRAAVEDVGPRVRSALAQARSVLTDTEQATLFALLSRFIRAHDDRANLTA